MYYLYKIFSFVGFSSGGLFARCIFMKLWNLPYFTADILSHSLTCIMFGPLLLCHSSSRVFYEDCPDAFPYLHSFFLKDDLWPKSHYLCENTGVSIQYGTSVVSQFCLKCSEFTRQTQH